LGNPKGLENRLFKMKKKSCAPGARPIIFFYFSTKALGLAVKIT
jgi:hypothetical protein